MLRLAMFCAGVVCCIFLPALPDWRLLLVAVLLWPWRRHAPGLLLAFALGLAYATWRAELRLAQQLAPALTDTVLSVRGVVRDLPRVGEFGVRLRFAVEAEPGAPALPPLLELNDYQRRDWPAGSRWQLSLKLKPPSAAANVAGFDGEAWYWSEGVLASGSIGKTRQALGMADDGQARLDRLRQRLLQRLTAQVDDARAAAMVAALALGVRQLLGRADWQALATTGLTHVVSVSGLHITLVAGMVALLVQRVLRALPWLPLRQPRLWALAAAVLAAACYAALAGFSVPTQRTLWMLLTAALALALQRGLSPLQIWLAALGVVLLLDPFAALAPGFWLSFGLVGALLLMALGRRRAPGGWRAAVSAQAVASVASLLPLVLFFGQLPLLSPLANALGTPLVSLLLTPLSLLALLLPALATLAAALAQLFWYWVDLLAAWPPLYLPQPPLAVSVAALAGSLLLILPWSGSGRLCGACLLLPLLLYRVPAPAPGTLAVTVLDVGQGLSVLLRTHGHSLLFDTGAGDAQRVLLPVLRAQGVMRLDVLLLSHHDNDHDGAADGLRAALPVARVLAGQPGFYAGALPCRAGDSWAWDGVRFDVLWPRPDSRGDDNALSCVLRVATAGQALLISGDAPQTVEHELVTRYGTALRSQLLVLGHHGSRTSSAAAWLETVAPQWALVSAGYRNRYRHPHPQVLARLEQAGIAVARTDWHGALQLQLDGHRHQLTARRRQHRRYWQRPVPG